MDDKEETLVAEQIDVEEQDQTTPLSELSPAEHKSSPEIDHPVKEALMFQRSPEVCVQNTEITPETDKFRRQSLRNSILKRLTISWKREYDFQSEADKVFAEEGKLHSSNTFSLSFSQTRAVT